MQKFFDQFEGVIATEVGYANGPDHAPSYREVCDNSGHAETVRVEYDEAVLSLPELLRFYFQVIDPVSVNRQGMDAGIQYRTGIYYTDEDQLPAIEASSWSLSSAPTGPITAGLWATSSARRWRSRSGRSKTSFPRSCITRSTSIRIRAATATFRRGTFISKKKRNEKPVGTDKRHKKSEKVSAFSDCFIRSLPVSE